VCFSPEADVAAGIVVGAVGIDALRRVTDRRELLLASLPLAFAAHQLVEAFVWWGSRGQVEARVGDVATWIYLIFAFALPVIVPAAVLSTERDRGRRRIMSAFVGLGAIVTLVLFAALVGGPVGASAHHMHIAYELRIPAGGLMTALYVVSVCGALLASTRPTIRWFGIVNGFAVIVLALAIRDGFASLWCVWAAVTSVLIDLHLRHTRRRELGAVAATP
jgi:Family of unknown function (DUF6629)